MKSDRDSVTLRRSTTAKVAFAVAIGGLAYIELLVFVLQLKLEYSLLLALAPAAGAAYLFYREAATRPRIEGEDLLRAMIETLYPAEQSVHFRANVMWFNPKKRKLVVRCAYNMDDYVDRHIQLTPGQGCAGQCFRSGDITVFDFSQMTHSQYGVDTKTTPVWGDLRAIVSYPIQESDEGNVVGVLSIDTDLASAVPGFKRPTLHKVLGIYAQLVLKVLAPA